MRRALGTRRVQDELVRQIRDYARGRLGKRLFTDGELWVSSAWLAREFDVDPRTIAAALRLYGIRSAEVERGVRGYQISQLAGIQVDDEDVDARPVLSPPVLDGVTGGVPADQGPVGAPPAAGSGPALEAVPPVSAVERLSAAAGHDMTGALRAAGLL